MAKIISGVTPGSHRQSAHCKVHAITAAKYARIRKFCRVLNQSTSVLHIFAGFQEAVRSVDILIINHAITTVNGDVIEICGCPDPVTASIRNEDRESAWGGNISGNCGATGKQIVVINTIYPTGEASHFEFDNVNDAPLVGGVAVS